MTRRLLRVATVATVLVCSTLPLAAQALPRDAAAPAAVPGAKPSKPIEVVATGFHRRVRLTWSAPASDGGSPVTGYRVQRSTNGTTWTTIAPSAPLSRVHVATGLTNGTQYFFRVAARNADGLGSNSNIATARPKPVPNAVRRFRASAGDGSATIRWRAPKKNGTGPITGYRIGTRSPGGAWSVVTTVAPSVRTFIIAPVANGTTRSFRVIARNAVGNGPESAIRTVSPPTTRSLTVGHHTCAVMPDRTGLCWGNDASGQLGNGTDGGSVRTPSAVVGSTANRLTDIVDMSVGLSHTCAVIADGSVRCSGANADGQLGDSSLSSSSNLPTTVRVLGFRTLRGAVDVDSGDATSCAVLDDGTARCWGRNDKGQVGNGASGADRRTATTVTVFGGDDLVDVAQVAVGSDHSCAVLDDGAARCWGANVTGQLGNAASGSGFAFAGAVRADGGGFLTDATSIGAGSGFSCALVSDGTVRCWGSDTDGQVGNGSTTGHVSVATTVLEDGETLTGVTSLSVGSRHACARLEDGTARCWGSNASGELATGTEADTYDSATPVTVDGTHPLTGIVDIVAGRQATCARLVNGTVRCWGSNEDGGLGDGTLEHRLLPVRPLPL